MRTDAQAWLVYGQHDLKAAQTLYRAGHYMAAAFHCHQAMEKGLKAVWAAVHQEEPPRIHNLRLLLLGLTSLDPPPVVIETSLEATPHYVTARMPGWPPDDPKMYTRDYTLALLRGTEETWTWCLQNVNSRTSSTASTS